MSRSLIVLPDDSAKPILDAIDGATKSLLLAAVSTAPAQVTLTARASSSYCTSDLAGSRTHKV